MVQCISKGGKPATSITWRMDGEVVREGVEEKVEAVEASKRTITVSSLQLRGQRNMSGSVLQCEATNGNQAETVSTKIEVKIFRTKIFGLPIREASYPYDIKNQRKARNAPSRGLWVP